MIRWFGCEFVIVVCDCVAGCYVVFAVRLVLIVLWLFISFGLYTLNCVVVRLSDCRMDCVVFLGWCFVLLFVVGVVRCR